MNLINDLITDTDVLLGDIVLNIYGALTAPALGIWTGAAVVMLIYFGVLLMLGQLNEVSVYKSGSVFIKFFFIYALITVWEVYNGFFYNLFTNSSEFAGNIILAASGASENGTTTQLNLFYEKSTKAAGDVMDGAGSLNFSAYFYAGFIFVSAFLLAGYGTFLIILAKLAIAVLLALGPLFILFALFQNTRGFFEGWIRMMVNYALIPLLVYTVLAFVLQLSESAVDKLAIEAANGDGRAGVVMPFAAVSIISFLLLVQIMNISSGITGGFALSTNGAYGALFKKPYGVARNYMHQRQNAKQYAKAMTRESMAPEPPQKDYAKAMPQQSSPSSTPKNGAVT